MKYKLKSCRIEIYSTEKSSKILHTIHRILLEPVPNPADPVYYSPNPAYYSPNPAGAGRDTAGSAPSCRISIPKSCLTLTLLTSPWFVFQLFPGQGREGGVAQCQLLDEAQVAHLDRLNLVLIWTTF